MAAVAVNVEQKPFTSAFSSREIGGERGEGDLAVCLVFYYPPDPIRGGPPRAALSSGAAPLFFFVLFFGSRKNLNRPEKFESNRTVRCRPIGLFICKEIAISAKEPNWAFLIAAKKRQDFWIHFVLLHILDHAEVGPTTLNPLPQDNFNSVFRANGVRSAGPKIKKKVENLPVLRSNGPPHSSPWSHSFSSGDKEAS